MSENSKKRSLLPNLEILILAVFLFSFLMFAIPKCNQTQMEYDQAAKAEAEEALLSDDDFKPIAKDSSIVDKTPKDSTILEPNQNNANAASPALSADIPTPVTESVNFSATKLYVTIDQLNLRRGPSLDSAIVAKLPLFEEVFFLNEITNYTQQISLGPEIADEPWIKIQTKDGDQGWVYGAGVYYYKRKRLPDDTDNE